MPYKLLFCLVSDDNGTSRNPALAPILDPEGKVLLYYGLDDVHRAINRLRRLADGLVYYTAAIDHIEPPMSRPDRISPQR